MHLKNYTLVLFISFLVSCGQNRQSNQSALVDSAKQYIDSIKTAKPANLKPANETLKINSTHSCQLSSPDTSVFGIKLNDSQSKINQVGDQFELRNDNEDLPYEKFCSLDKQQILTLFFHPGGSKNEFSEFQLTYYSKKDAAAVVKTAVFKTEKGIELGLSMQKLIAVLGYCFKTVKTNKNTEIIKYQIDDFKHSEFLKRYNMPLYYAEYEFKNDKLIRFRFGFEYP
ncbi:MAG: hypothetical protein ACOYOV_16775 [Bacteroidales bacterium]